MYTLQKTILKKIRPIFQQANTMSAFAFNNSDVIFREPVPSDIDVSQSCTPISIASIVEATGVQPGEYDLYGSAKCKVSLDVRHRLADQPDGNYVVVTGINPTPLGKIKNFALIKKMKLSYMPHALCPAIGSLACMIS